MFWPSGDMMNIIQLGAAEFMKNYNLRRIKTMKRLLALACSLAIMATCLSACGKTEPQSPPAVDDSPEAALTETTSGKWEWGDITFVVPFSAGGGADTVARLLAEYWGQELGTNFIIDNRGGANTEIGTTYYVNEAPKDATAIYMGVQIYYSSCIQTQNADYDYDDVTVMNFVELDPCNIVVTKDSPYQTFEELNEAVLANPGKFSISATAGGDQMLMIGVLQEKLGWDVKIINYDGATERMTALLGGHVDMCATTLAGSLDQDVTQIVNCGTERNAAVPDIPTLREVCDDETLPFMGSSRFVGIHSSVLEEYPERYQILYDSLERVMQPGTDYMKAVAASNRDTVTGWKDWDTNQELQAAFWDSCTEYKSYLTAE